MKILKGKRIWFTFHIWFTESASLVLGVCCAEEAEDGHVKQAGKATKKEKQGKHTEAEGSAVSVTGDEYMQRRAYTCHKSNLYLVFLKIGSQNANAIQREWS